MQSSRRPRLERKTENGDSNFFLSPKTGSCGDQPVLYVIFIFIFFFPGDAEQTQRPRRLNSTADKSILSSSPTMLEQMKPAWPSESWVCGAGGLQEFWTLCLYERREEVDSRCFFFFQEPAPGKREDGAQRYCTVFPGHVNWHDAVFRKMPWRCCLVITHKSDADRPASMWQHPETGVPKNDYAYS